MSRLLVATITNIWHQILALESAPNSVIDTLGLSPTWLNKTNLIIKLYEMLRKYAKV